MVASRQATSAKPLSVSVPSSHDVPITPLDTCPPFFTMMFSTRFLAISGRRLSGAMPKASGRMLAVAVLLP